MEQDINTTNKSIAKYMGWENTITPYYWTLPSGSYRMILYFESSWNELMPVIEKIASEIYCDWTIKQGKELGKTYYKFCFVNKDGTNFISTSAWKESSLEAAYICVSRYMEFIKEN